LFSLWASLAIFPGQAQALNYTGIAWKTVETEHFVIHFHPGAEMTARRVMKWSEVAYVNISRQFNYALKEKINIVVRDLEDISNGFAVSELDWLTVWSSNFNLLTRGTSNWIPTVLHHELSHIFASKVNSPVGEGVGEGGVGGGLFEDGRHNIDIGLEYPMPFGFNYPYYWAEGGSEYWAESGGLTWWNSSHDMLLRSAILENQQWTFDEWSTKMDKEFPFSELGYNMGYSLALYVKTKYGPEVFRKFAEENSKFNHVNWEDSIKDVLKISAEDLYKEWLEWAREHYSKFYEDLRIDQVEGEMSYDPELILTESDYETLRPVEKRQAAGGAWVTNTQVSANRKWFGYQTDDSIILRPSYESLIPGYRGQMPSKDDAGKIVDGTRVIENVNGIPGGWSFSPDGKYIVFTRISPLIGNEYIAFSPYERSELWIAELSTFSSLDLGFGPMNYVKDYKITKGMRAFYPAWSPAGRKIAFVKASDGQLNLCVINSDGSGFLNLTKFNDGSLINSPKWSPDGTRIVFSMFKNDQQDIWMVDADGRNLRAITLDKAEDRDPVFNSNSRKVIYSSDRSGVFNLYSVELETGETFQLTNVIGGAYFPFVDDLDTIYFSNWTAYGLKSYTLPREDYYNKLVPNLTAISAEAVSDFLHSRHDELPELSQDNVSSYRPIKSLMPPVGIPMLIYEDQNFKGGVELILQDYLEHHALIGDFLIGEDSDISLRYIYDGFFPTMQLGYGNFRRSQVYSILHDEEDSYEDIKSEYVLNMFYGGFFLDFSPSQSTTSKEQRLRLFYDLRLLSDNNPEVLFGYGEEAITRHSLNLGYDFNSFGTSSYFRSDVEPNPRGGWSLSLDYSFAHSANNNPETGENPYFTQGDFFDDYYFHTLQADARFYIALAEPMNHPSFDHTLELDFLGGWINRNVQYYDEFFAGGQHPYRTGGTFATNTAFSGYEDFSLHGETALIFNLIYRFPLLKDLSKRTWLVYWEDVYAQVFTSFGNLWGYRLLRTEPSEYDNPECPGCIPEHDSSGNVVEGQYANEREIPFVDSSFNSGHDMLVDVGFELRFRNYIQNYAKWYSFVRMAYGFYDIQGPGDVNDDGIYTKDEEYKGDPYVDEKEQSALRVFVGIGTGWN
jgi:hypothetical protein